MGVPKISTFVIGLIWVGFFAAVFGGFLAESTTKYNTPYNQSQMATFNKLDKLQTEVEGYKNSTLSFKENTGVFDVIGGYFSNGYRTMKITLSSLDIFMSMTNDALDNATVDIPVMSYLKVSIILTVLVFLIIGVMLSAILKKDV